MYIPFNFYLLLARTYVLVGVDKQISIQISPGSAKILFPNYKNDTGNDLTMEVVYQIINGHENQVEQILLTVNAGNVDNVNVSVETKCEI